MTDRTRESDIRARIRKEMSDLMDKAMRDPEASLYQEAEARYVANKGLMDNEFTTDHDSLYEIRERLFWAIPKLMDTLHFVTYILESDKNARHDALSAQVHFEHAMRLLDEVTGLAYGDKA